MGRRICTVILLWGMVLLLSSCQGLKLFEPAEELYALPALPQDYAELNRTIQNVMGQIGAEYAAPTSGSNTSAVQLLDLDGDNTQESAAVFLRMTSAEAELPLKIYLFRKGSDGSYRMAYLLEGEGNTVNSIVYEDLTGDGRREVVVSWQLSSGVYMLSVYGLAQAGASEIMYTTYNESYVLSDLDRDGCRELVVISGQSSVFYAEYYDYFNGSVTMLASAPLSANVSNVETVRSGQLVGQVPALYITSACSVDQTQVVDILAVREGALVNVTRREDSGISSGTMRMTTTLGAMDMNGDGVLEIPSPFDLPRVDQSTANPSYNRIVYWRQYDERGESTITSITYHSLADGWYLFIPHDWVGQLVVERSDALAVRGERAVRFCRYDSRTGQRQTFLTIYRLTGENRTARALINDRQMLMSAAATVYAAEFMHTDWEHGMTMRELKEQFELITQSWSSGS